MENPFNIPNLLELETQSRNRRRIHYLADNDEDDIENSDYSSARYSNNDEYISNVEDFFDENGELFSEFDISSQRPSQLSQIFAQSGQFTYLSYFNVEDYDDFGIRTKISKQSHTHPICRDSSFFHSIKEALLQHQFPVLANTIVESYFYFANYSTVNLDFLRLFLRDYRRISVESMDTREFYLSFWR